MWTAGCLLIRIRFVRLLNSLNAELDSMRPTTLFSHLEAAQYNVNRKQQDLRFFEFGKVFNRSGDSYTEVSTLSLLISGRRNRRTGIHPKK